MTNYIHFHHILSIFLTFTSTIAFDIRLQQGNLGLIEIQLDSTWYTVCYDHPNTTITRSFTNELVCAKVTGNENASARIYSDTTRSENSLRVFCRGSESDISECRFEVADCNDATIAGVVCSGGSVGSVGSSCKTEFNFRCNMGTCIPRAWVCDGESDCHSGEDEENCNSYLHQFEKHEKLKPSAEPKQSWRLISLDGCASRCAEAEDFICASFAFRPRANRITSLCLLSDQNRDSGLDLVSNRQFDYYERSVQLITPACNFTCEDGACLSSGKFVCDGVKQCLDGSDEKNCVSETPQFPFSVRLVNGSTPSEGRIEVRVNGSWGVICDDYWTIRDADVLCREAGFPRGALQVHRNAHFGNGNGMYFMDDVHCKGNETSISKCEFNGWGIHDCQEDEAAGVVCDASAQGCKEMEFQCDTNKCILLAFVCDGDTDCIDGSDETGHLCNSTVQVRLMDGVDDLSGRVEVRYRGVWGTICDDNWDDADAQVVCRSLGYHGHAKAHRASRYGVGSGPIWLDDVHCFGLEKSLNECEKSGWLKHNCNHQEDAGVTCSRGIEVEEMPLMVKNILPAECGERTVNDSPNDLDWYETRIVGGTDSEYGAHPWIVGVRIKVGRFSISLHWCGGTIISEFFVVSAAHCYDEVSLWSKYIIRSGDYDNAKTETWEEEFTVQRVILHEEYQKGRKNNNDIALVKIKPNEHGGGFQFGSHVAPACLPSPDTPYTPGTKCVVAGWGTTGGRDVSRLQSVAVPILSRAICSQPQAYEYARLTAGMFCAGDMAGGLDSCKGDSGGPFVCENSGRFTLYGIVSWGQGCGLPNKPGIYVTVKHYLGWIYDKLVEDATNSTVVD